jgi:hypothetical protein
LQNAVRDLQQEREAAAKAKVSAQVKPRIKASIKKVLAVGEESGGELDKMFALINAGKFKVKHVETKEAMNLFAKPQQGASNPEEVISDTKPNDAKAEATKLGEAQLETSTGPKSVDTKKDDAKDSIK